MALPTLLKTWRFNVNKIQASAANLDWHRQMMRAIKDALIGDGAWGTEPTSIWTVDYSCDSVTAGTPGDAVDRWDADTDLVWDRELDPHSWIVFNTGINGGAAQLCINLDNNASSSVNSQCESIEVVFSWGGNFTGGSTTARPTATDESDQLTQIVVGDWAGGQTGTCAATSWHMLMSDDGEEMRLFMLRENKCYAFWGLGTLVDSPVTENWWGTVWSDAATTTDCLNCWDNDSGWFHEGIIPRAVVEGGTCHVSHMSGYGDINDFSPFYNSNGGDVSATGFQGDGIGDETRNESPFGKIRLWNMDTAGFRGPKGQIKDMWTISVGRLVGALYPADNTKQFHQYGWMVAAPWDGTSLPVNTR
jgi:hypothetical protein